MMSYRALHKNWIVATFGIGLLVVIGCGADETMSPTGTSAPPQQIAATSAPTSTAAPAATAVPTRAPTATTAPVATNTPSGPAKGGTLKIASVGSVKALDPLWSNDSATGNVVGSILEGLLVFNDDYSLGKQLVESWSSSADSLTWTFRVRSDVTFHDGTALTADHVIAALNRQKTAAPIFKLVQTQFGTADFAQFVKKADERSFTINLTTPAGLVPYAIGPQNFQPLVVNSSWAKIPQTEPAPGNPIGTGPYRFDSWTPGDRWSMIRYDIYKPSSDPANGQAGAQVAYFDKVEYIEITDQTTRVAALEVGQVDVVQELLADLQTRLAQNPKIQLIARAPDRVEAHFNQTKAPFDNVDARRAVVMAFDNEKALLLSAGNPSAIRLCPSLMQCGTVWESRAGSAAYFNVKKTAEAKALIAKLGLAGTTVRIMAATDRHPSFATAQVSREVMEDIGFKVEFLAMDWASVVSRRSDLKLWEFFPTFGGSSLRLGPVGHLAWTPIHKNGWFNKYQDDSGKMTQLLAKLAKETDPGRQKQILEDIQIQFYDDAAAMQIGEFYSKWAARSDLKGVVPESPAAWLPANKWIGK